MARNKRINLEALTARIHVQGAGARLTRGEAAALIASKVKRENESVRAARNRIGMQLDRSHEQGADALHGGLSIGPDKKYIVQEIKRWANHQERYPGVFEWLPHIPGEIPTRLASGMGFAAGLQHEVLPRTLEECHAELRRVYALLERSRKELSKQELDCQRRLKLVRNFQGRE